MNTLNTSSRIQTISNTTSLSNGILKKLAITLAVSAIGVSALAPVAYAEGEVVAQPGDTIIVEDEGIYGISGNFQNGGTLTVKNGGISFADQLREAAGEDNTFEFEEFFNYVDEPSDSPTAKKFESLMGNKIDANGIMNVEDIISIIPVFDVEDDLPITDGMTRDEIFTLFKNSFTEQTLQDYEINQLTYSLYFNRSQQGENVYQGYETESIPLLKVMSRHSNDDFRYRLAALAKLTDSEGNITYEKFESSLPSHLYYDGYDYDQENSGTDGDGENDDDSTFGHRLLDAFKEEATDGKLSIGDVWKLIISDSDFDEETLETHATFLNHAGNNLILSKAEFLTAGAELAISSAELNAHWNSLKKYSDDTDNVEATTAIAYLDSTNSANDFLQEGESEFNNWNTNGRVTTQNVSEIINHAFGQAQYYNPNPSEGDYKSPYVDPQKVLNSLGSASNDSYDAKEVYDAIIDVYMAQWQVDFDNNAQPNLDKILEKSGNNGRISIDDYITSSGLSGEKETAVRALLETTADDNGTVPAFDAYYADNYDDLILEIYSKTDINGPLSVREIIKSLPDGISSENKATFENQLKELAGEEDQITREVAKEKLTEFVLENPGNEIEQVEGKENIRGYLDPDGNNPEYIGINLSGEKDISLNNEVQINAHQGGISVNSISSTTGEFSGDVSVINSGEIGSDNNGIYLGGKNVILNNSGDIYRDGGDNGLNFGVNGILAEASQSINVINTGEIAVHSSSTAINAFSFGGDITMDNDGDLFTNGTNGFGINIFSGINQPLPEDEAIEGGTVKLTNSGTIRTDGNSSYAISTWSNGGIVDVTNSGKLTTLQNNSAGINIYSGTDKTKYGLVKQEGGKVKVTNSGTIRTSGNDSYGITAGSYGGTADGINSGNITTKGDDSTAITISSGTNKTSNERVPLIGGDVTLNNSGALSTEGARSLAIDIWSNGGKVDLINEGTLTTAKDDSAGIDAYSGTNRTAGNRVVQDGKAVSVNNSGAISTAGNESSGLSAGSYGGAVDVDNSGDISTKGLDSAALILTSGNTRTDGDRVPKEGSDVIAKNTGDLSTEGDYSSGLHAFSNGGKITASNEGKIVTGGEESHGIRLSSGLASRDSDVDEQVGGDITLTNEGAVETTGENVANIKAWSNGGNINITNEANLTLTGDISEGIQVISGHEEDGKIITQGGDVTIKNTGNILATGIDGVGIETGSYGGDVTIDNTADVSGLGGGIFVETSKKGELTNSGKITSTGIDGAGIAVLADDTSTLTNTGNVQVEGELGLAALALNSALIVNSGDVSLVRNWSEAASSWNPAIGAISLNDASLKNSGKVTVSGDNMIGLYAGETNSDATKKATIENSGVVTTKGNDKAHAAYIKLDGTGTIKNTGSLITEGKTNAVVVEGTGDFALDNSAAGLIEAKDGIALVTEETKDTITNLGTIKGGATLAAGDDVLDNKGTLAGHFDFGDGKDTLTVSDFSKVSDATFDGGASDDIANLSGGGEIAKDQIVNFETANLLSGDFSGDVMDKFTKLVNVNSGASISGFTKVNNLTSNGTVSVAAGETLDVTGDLNIEGGKFNLGVDSTSKHAVVNVGGDASFASTANLFINVAKDGTIKQDESVTVLNGKTLTFGDEIASTLEGVEDEFEVDDDYISYDFSGRVETTSTGKSLILTARDSIGSTIEAVGEKFGGAIEYIAALSGDKKSEQNSVLTELATMVDNGQVQEAQNLMNEVVSSPGASSIASTQNTNSFTAGNMVINRAAARIEGGFTATLSAEEPSNILGYNPEYKSAPQIRNIMAMTDEGTETSIAATGYNGEIWMQVYGVRQQNNGIVSGDTNVFGGAAGIDFLVDPNTVFGLGLVYSTSDSDADTTNAHTDLETDSYGLTAYGMTRFAEDFRLGGALAYYWNDHDLKRQILANQMSASYDSTTLVARAEIGKEFAMDGYTFMPQIGAIYTHNSADAYTETGPLAQSIGKSQTDSFIGSIGFVVDSQQDWDGMIVRPEFHMNVLHEFNDELGSFAGSLAADNTVSVSSTITSLEETRFNIGGGLKLNHTDVFASELGYDGIFADKTQEHVFRYKASYKF